MIKLTKQDLMKLPKERLASIILDFIEQEEHVLEELKESPGDKQIPLQPYPYTWPYTSPSPYKPFEVWYEKNEPSNTTPCFAPNGVCTNPFHDCLNCPIQFGGGGNTYTSNGTSDSGWMNKTSQTISTTSKPNVNTPTITSCSCSKEQNGGVVVDAQGNSDGLV